MYKCIFLGLHIKFKSTLQNYTIAFFWQRTILCKPQNQGDDYLWEEERADGHQET